MQVIVQAPAAANATVTTAGSLGVFNVIAGEPGAGTQCNLNVPGSNRLNGQPFVVRAGGILNMAAGTYTATVQPLVFASSTVGFTAAAANAAYSGAAVALTFTATTAVATPFEFELHCIGDSTSGVLNGWYQSLFATTSVGAAFTLVTASPTLLTTAGHMPTSVNFAKEPPVQFAVGIGLSTGTAAAGSVATLTQFQLEA